MFNVKKEKKIIFLLDLLYAEALLAMASDRRLLPNWFGKGGRRTDTSSMDVYTQNIPFFWQESLDQEDRSKEQLGGLGWIEEWYLSHAVLSNVVAKVVHEYMQSWHLNVI